MLTSQKVVDAINEQIGYEFSASLQYCAIGAHFAAEALPQLSQHFFLQAEEEKGHALRFIKYVVDAGGRVIIPGIEAPKSKFKTARDAAVATSPGPTSGARSGASAYATKAMNVMPTMKTSVRSRRNDIISPCFSSSSLERTGMSA